MDTIERLLAFLNSYPLWAKLSAISGILFSVMILILTPRQSSVTPPQNGPILLHIKAVRLFPEDPEAEVQIMAIVNGIIYQHPSVGGVKWMKVGPDMSQKIIELPDSEVYLIRFELKLRSGSALVGEQERRLDLDPERREVSQVIRQIRKLPFKEDYKLYDVNGEVRSAGVSAVISYELTREQ